MSLILSIETATPVCSMALHDKGQLIADANFYIDKAHGSVLTPAIHFLLQQSGYQLKDLTAVSVSKGPGSYTGLRIGVSVAKGLCFSLDIPLISVNTLEVMVQEVSTFIIDRHQLLCPMLDARRMEVYTALYDHTLREIQPVKALIVDEESTAELINNNLTVFFGSGAVKCREVLLRSGNASVIDGVVPTAKWGGFLAYHKLVNKQLEDLDTFEPFYLKEFVANKAKL